MTWIENNMAYLVIGLAAVIIGEVIFGKIFRNFALKLLAVSLGAILYYLVIQVVLWLGLDANDLKLLTALVVAVFLGVPYWKNQLLSRTKGSKGGVKNAIRTWGRCFPGYICFFPGDTGRTGCLSGGLL